MYCPIPGHMAVEPSGDSMELGAIVLNCGAVPLLPVVLSSKQGPPGVDGDSGFNSGSTWAMSEADPLCTVGRWYG